MATLQCPPRNSLTRKSQDNIDRRLRIKETWENTSFEKLNHSQAGVTTLDFPIGQVSNMQRRRHCLDSSIANSYIPLISFDALLFAQGNRHISLSHLGYLNITKELRLSKSPLSHNYINIRRIRSNGDFIRFSRSRQKTVQDVQALNDKESPCIIQTQPFRIITTGFIEPI